ncbi:hypothetical protein E3A20_10100, partial [Planctomyces bekefii]
GEDHRSGDERRMVNNRVVPERGQPMTNTGFLTFINIFRLSKIYIYSYPTSIIQ